MYQVSLNRIPESGELKEEALSLGLAELDLGPPFTGPQVDISYSFRRLFDKVFGQVQVSTRARLCCGRCLQDFDATIRADFKVQFEPAAEGQREDYDDEDSGYSAALYVGEDLPLGEELRQELELQLPYAPLCKEGCLGLCPHCGKNLNDGDCGCPRGPEGGAFAGLEKLIKKPKP